MSIGSGSAAVAVPLPRNLVHIPIFFCIIPCCSAAWSLRYPPSPCAPPLLFLLLLRLPASKYTIIIEARERTFRLSSYLKVKGKKHDSLSSCHPKLPPCATSVAIAATVLLRCVHDSTRSRPRKRRDGKRRRLH